MFPGITERVLNKLKKEDLAVVKAHIGSVKSSVQKKQDLLEGKLGEFGEAFKKPKDETDKLAKLIKKIQKHSGKDLLVSLLAMEVDFRELIQSVEEEFRLIRHFEKNKGIKFKKIAKEIEDEIIIANVVEHQLNLLISIKKLNFSAMQFSKSSPTHKIAESVGKQCASIDDLIHFIARIIFEEEVPNLSIIYNMLRLEEWKDIEKTIMRIKLNFFEIRQSIL